MTTSHKFRPDLFLWTTVTIMVAGVVIIAVMLLSACGHYEYREHHCIVTGKGVKPAYVGSAPNYWILLTCPGLYDGKPWAEDLAYLEWAHVQLNDQRTVEVRTYVRRHIVGK